LRALEIQVFPEALGEGIERGREEIAQRLLAKGYSLADIAESTELSLAHVKRLKTPTRLRLGDVG
jgi:predicted transposase YdaD